jgi:uncharacterized iron-regulated protein
MELSSLGLAAVLAVTPPAVPPSFPVPSAAPGAAPTVVARQGAALTGWSDYLRALSAASVVCVGEQHDQAPHHAVQAETVRELAARRPVTVALEMVSVDQQGTLDDFLAGRMSETDFAAWWDKNWGYPYAIYKPIFDAARAASLPVAGINVPRALIREVARKGVAGLTPAERAQLPASIAESADPRYRAYIESSLDEHGPMPADRRARMREAQAVWNEAMGANAFRLSNGGRLVVVVAGQGHMLYGGGIPESAARRGASALTVLPYGDAMSLPDALARLQDPASADIALADYFRLLP